MIGLKVKCSNINNFSVPVISLSTYVLTEKEQNHLKYGLQYCFIDKYLSAELETLVHQVLNCVEPENLNENREFFQAYADIFSSNIYKSIDYIYHDLKSLITSKDIQVLKIDKN